MYCHLCHTEAPPSHDSSSGHRAARELIAAALDRLSNHLSAGDSAEGFNASSEAGTDTSTKTPEAVSFCDTCNTVYAINEQTSHYKQKKHALAVLNEQTFEELVQAYIGEEPKPETPSEASEDVAFVDKTEAVNTYTCHLCALDIPLTFRTEHEHGPRHRANRTFAFAAARRARDMFANADTCGENKFSGKMMKKLLKMYTGDENIGTENIEDVREEPEPSNPEDSPREPKLTPKQYFTDVLPYLPYVGTFNTLYIDNTEFVTIQIGSETLKIHVNNLNGLYNVDGKEGYYMNCRLCDEFSTYYPSVGEQDKQHILSLGHVKNVFSAIDNVHLIRKIDESHAICHLCNLHIAPFAVEDHILKDARHTTALTEALELGKDFIETKDHLKIMIYLPSAPKVNVFKPNQNRWLIGIPKQPKNTLFGSAQAFGNAQNGFGTANAFGQTQGSFGISNAGFSSNNAQATGFGTVGVASVQNSGFGNAQNTFGSAQNANFGSTQPSFGSNQNKSSLFGATQNTGFGNAQNATSFGAPYNNATGFGTNNGFSVAQNNASFGAPQNNTRFGATQNSSFGVVQNKGSVFGAQNTSNNSASGVAQNQGSVFAGQKAPNNSVFGVAQTQNNATGFVVAQNQGSVFGAQKTYDSYHGVFGVAQTQNNATGFGVAQTNATSSGVAQNSTGFGVSPDNATSIKTTYSSPAEQIKNLSTDTTRNNPTDVNVAQNKPIIGARNSDSGANQNKRDFGATAVASDFGAVQKAIGHIFDNTHTSAQKQELEKSVEKKQSSFGSNLTQNVSSGFKNIQNQSGKSLHDKNRNIDKKQMKTDGKMQRIKRSPPRRFNYSSSSSSDTE
ncbi:nucleoporin NSP1-like [Leguminivora glycinivorella]|uniref:nucleoporin NSP1-like n=1 Tax=Leguminivora glycinivorella TaxID=1035111 RepID=UPI00200E000E|nr:nucleoporin NSP1-like [Leguminivora glycinivorella]